MENNNTQHRIDEFFTAYEEHLNTLLAANASACQNTEPLTEQVMELGPLGILYGPKKDSKPENLVDLISSDTRILDNEHAIACIKWKYAGRMDDGSEFIVFYLLKTKAPRIDIFASVTGDEEGLREQGLRSIYKLYLNEKRRQLAQERHNAYSFSAN